MGTVEEWRHVLSKYCDYTDTDETTYNSGWSILITVVELFFASVCARCCFTFKMEKEENS